jgi:fructoselysine 6-kinase
MEEIIMKIIAVGDNVVDCYVDQNVYYPGGNCVNVAVNCKRNGCKESEYIGVFGTDDKAEHIKWALAREGVVYERSRTVIGISGQPRVKHTPQGDRVFVGSPENTVQKMMTLKLVSSDLERISNFDVCHTSCYSLIETELPAIKERCSVSFDFSERMERWYLQMVCPHVEYAFFSGSHLRNEEIINLMDECHRLGVSIVGVTLGSRGVMFSEKGRLYSQGIVNVDVVDTMGAGDSFIAGFLTHYIDNGDMGGALEYAAQRAAQTCTVKGAFGYPHVLDLQETDR